MDVMEFHDRADIRPGEWNATRGYLCNHWEACDRVSAGDEALIWSKPSHQQMAPHSKFFSIPSEP